MTIKRPLVNVSGTMQELPATDSLYSVQGYHGIESAGALSFDNSTHVVTVAAGTNTYWYKGVQYTTANAITCDLDDYVTLAANTLYYVAFDDASGTLKASTTAVNLKTQCPVCMVYWNGSAGALTKETHNHTRNIDWHINSHRTIGTRYYSGLDLLKPTTADDATLTIAAGVIYDEDIMHSIAEQTTSRVFYLASANAYTFADYSLPYPGTTGAPQYLDTDTYSLTAVGSNKYACYWVYASADISRPIYIIPSAISSPYNTLALARAETAPALTGFGLTPELKLIYRLIYNGDGNFQESADYRTSSSLPSGYIASTTAGAVSFTPYGSVSATNVQTAIQEILDEMPSSSGMAYSVISSNTNATAGHGYLINATSSAVTLTLPSAPSVGDTVAAVDAYDQATTNLITIARNGHNIEGSANDLIIDISGAGFTLVYADSTRGWEIVSEIGTQVTMGLFELDVDGGLMPISGLNPDEYYELDSNGDVMPIAV